MRHEILRMLENNSRIDLHDLAIMLGTDESVVLEEIEKMENEGIICGYPTLINWDKTDTEKVTAFIEVRVTPQRGHVCLHKAFFIRSSCRYSNTFRPEKI